MDNLPTTLPDTDEERTSFWRDHVQTWQQSGLNQSAYAARHQLPLSRFNYWKRKFTASETAAFVQVNLDTSASVRIYHRSGAVIECLPGTDTHWLRDLLGMHHAS